MKWQIVADGEGSERVDRADVRKWLLPQLERFRRQLGRVVVRIRQTGDSESGLLCRVTVHLRNGAGITVSERGGELTSQLVKIAERLSLAVAKSVELETPRRLAVSRGAENAD